MLHTKRESDTTDFGGACLHCGYSLRGLPSPRCPECGSTFDPDDPTTFLNHPGVPRLWQRVLRASGKRVKVAVIIAFVLTLYVGSLPAPVYHGEGHWQLLLLLTPWALVATFILGRRLARWCIIRHYDIPDNFIDVYRDRRTHAARWFVVGAVLLVLRVPFATRFWLSYPFLTHYAYRQHQVVPYPNVDTRDRWLGLYLTDGITVEPSGVTIRLLDGGVLRYEPDGRLSGSFRRYQYLERLAPSCSASSANELSS